ncbi:lactadherin-like [Lytechinus variegatus]|uniref:lactadherin-like n=1 Tax=Lytechinus variegatus TaxID=7654 RepID=UPI001BB231C6|nr:lactadherin-like [Lytechinus variegatus]
MISQPYVFIRAKSRFFFTKQLGIRGRTPLICFHSLTKEPFLRSLRLVGGNETEGRLVVTSQADPTTDMLVHQGDWPKNASQFVCKYLGYEGAYATVGGDLFEIPSSPNNSYDAVSLRCPANMDNVTRCWYKRMDWKIRLDKSIAIVCCTSYMCNTPRGSPLGLESGKIHDDAITVSSEWGETIVGKTRARLNGNSAWRPNIPDDADPWLQVAFDSAFIITTIITQGRPVAGTQWTTAYKVSYSMDGTSWTFYQDTSANTDKVFSGNYDGYSQVEHNFLTPIVCRYFRIHLLKSWGYMSLRLELTGYGPINELLAAMNQEESGCSHPLRGSKMGVEDGRIPNSSLTSSSYRIIDGFPLSAQNGRLNGGIDSNRNAGWLAVDDGKDIWVMIDVGQTSLITGIIVQGRHLEHQWVTSLKVSYSLDDFRWTFALEPQCEQVFPANYDNDTPVTIVFNQPLTARYVRIHPLSWSNVCGMRYEVLGIRD